MPGYTKAQLVEMKVETALYAWCHKCRLYWHKPGIRTRKHVGGAKVIAKFHIPLTPKPKKGDVVIIHPVYERFLNFLIDGAFKQWKEEQLGSVATTMARDRRALAPQTRLRKASTYKKRDYDVLTVNEAVAQLGLTREEIMAEFDEVMLRFEESRQRKGSTRKQGHP